MVPWSFQMSAVSVLQDCSPLPARVCVGVRVCDWLLSVKHAAHRTAVKDTANTAVMSLRGQGDVGVLLDITWQTPSSVWQISMMSVGNMLCIHEMTLFSVYFSVEIKMLQVFQLNLLWLHHFNKLRPLTWSTISSDIQELSLQMDKQNLPHVVNTTVKIWLHWPPPAVIVSALLWMLLISF